MSSRDDHRRVPMISLSRHLLSKDVTSHKHLRLGKGGNYPYQRYRWLVRVMITARRGFTRGNQNQ
ncbi:hypothetical protein SCFA_1250002 [anaerobic digester metagenome]|uniref:Uncharacterized protein n=1 Tax=anaerobic digester metagenome TaxID=1263854 RepID=A0A485LVE0_9ZZZZ